MLSLSTQDSQIEMFELSPTQDLVPQRIIAENYCLPPSGIVLRSSNTSNTTYFCFVTQYEINFTLSEESLATVARHKQVEDIGKKLLEGVVSWLGNLNFYAKCKMEAVHSTHTSHFPFLMARREPVLRDVIGLHASKQLPSVNCAQPIPYPMHTPLPMPSFFQSRILEQRHHSDFLLGKWRSNNVPCQASINTPLLAPRIHQKVPSQSTKLSFSNPIPKNERDPFLVDRPIVENLLLSGVSHKSGPNHKEPSITQQKCKSHSKDTSKIEFSPKKSLSNSENERSILLNSGCITKVSVFPQDIPVVRAKRGDWKCSMCKVTSTPRKRLHPTTKRPLCNACGLRIKHKMKKEGKKSKLGHKYEQVHMKTVKTNNNKAQSLGTGKKVCDQDEETEDEVNQYSDHENAESTDIENEAKELGSAILAKSSIHECANSECCTHEINPGVDSGHPLVKRMKKDN